MILFLPKTVFVPFEWDGRKWVKRDDLPRFRDIELISPYLQSRPEIHFRDGTPVPITYLECDRADFVQEYLRGVGTPEWLLLQKS